MKFAARETDQSALKLEGRRMKVLDKSLFIYFDGLFLVLAKSPTLFSVKHESAWPATTCSSAAATIQTKSTAGSHPKCTAKPAICSIRDASKKCAHWRRIFAPARPPCLAVHAAARDKWTNERHRRRQLSLWAGARRITTAFAATTAGTTGTTTAASFAHQRRGGLGPERFSCTRCSSKPARVQCPESK